MSDNIIPQPFEEIESRQSRLARRMLQRQAAGYDNQCFQMWLWFPLPNGEWEILFGEKAEELHIDLWESVGRAKMAKAWGIDSRDLGWGVGENAIPTGYVDFEERNFREYPVLVIPSDLPNGWDVERLKKLLLCGSRINQVKTSYRRSGQPEELKAMISLLKELQRDRPFKGPRWSEDS